MATDTLERPALIGPECILSYPTLFVPAIRKNPKPTDKPKFSVTTLYTHAAILTPEFAALKAAVLECAVAAFGAAEVKTMIAEGVFESPFRKDIQTKGYDPAIYAVRCNHSSGADHPPAVVGRSGLPITDKREVYPGVRARVSFSPRAYGGLNTGNKPGVILELRNVQNLGDGPRLAGGVGTGAEFAKLPEEAPAAMNDELKGMLD